MIMNEDGKAELLLIYFPFARKMLCLIFAASKNDLLTGL
jgi:hypothetical protein